MWPVTEGSGLKYVPFGSSGMMVSEVCAGTMTWGTFNTEEEATKQLDQAMVMGVNLIDTAEMYPVPVSPEKANLTEEIVGRWIKARVVEGKLDRSRVYIATKVAGHWNMFASDKARAVGMKAIAAKRHVPALEDGPVPELVPQQIKEACAASLRRMQLDYIDLYQFHWPQRYVPAFGGSQYDVAKERPEHLTDECFEQQVLAVKGLIDSGMIKHWGLSNETAYGVMKFCETAKRLGVPPPTSIQNDFSLLCRHYELHLAEVCRVYNVAGFPYGCLAGGLLTGKYHDAKYHSTDRKPEEARHTATPNFQRRYHCEASRAACEKYTKLAEKHNVTPTELALAWANSRFYNTSVILGSTSVEQMQQCVDAFKVTLPKQVLEQIDAIHLQQCDPNRVD